MTTTERLPALPLLTHRDWRRSVAEDDDHLAQGQFLLFADGAEHRLLALGAEPVRVGRGHATDLTLDDPLVSRRHATIVRRGAGVELHDDSSANGTWVNGRRIGRRVLVDGDVVSFGRVTVVFRDTTPVRIALAA